MKKLIALAASAVICLYSTANSGTAAPALAADTLSSQGFSYILNDSGDITITGYKGSEVSVFIPAQIDGVPVKAIQDEAFYWNEVYGVYIPDSIESIGKDFIRNDAAVFGESGSYAEAFSETNSYHFYTTDMLSGVFGEDIHWNYDLSSGHLTVSGSGAMPVYSGYSAWTLPYAKARDNIPWYDFRHIIKSAEIKGTVSTIGEAAFFECDRMTKITMNDYITAISDYAFAECSKLKDIRFSDSLTKIDPYVFIRNYQLEQVKFPAALKSISFTTFNGCDALSYVDIDPDNPYFCSADGVVYTKDMTALCFYPDAKTDTSYIIPEGITAISSYAMEGAAFLEELTLPSSLKTIDTEALALMGVKRFVIPENVSYLGAYCLYSNAAECIIFLGNAPQFSTSLFNAKGTAYTDMYCRFSDTSWETFMNTFTDNINWIDLDQYPEDGIALDAKNITVRERESAALTARISPLISSTLKWDVSDSSTAIVSDGIITGLKAGTCTVTVSDENGRYSAACSVTVTKGSEIAASEPALALNGEVSLNQSMNNYSVYGYIVKSYLNETDSGQIERIEYIGDQLTAERYSPDGGKPVLSVRISPEFPIFGSCFCGKKNNYIVSGKKNTTNQSGEILCVEKYSKEWSKLGSVIISSADTRVPFEASSCRMTEKDDYLFIHAGQLLQIGHQSNMTFKINTETMELLESMTFVSTLSTLSNFEQEGFASHSFNQFITEEDGFIYRVDHGEGAMHGIGISKCIADESIKNVSSLIVYPFHSGNTNATGASVGGTALSSNNIIIAANSIDQTLDSYPNGQRNVLLAIATKNLKNPRTVWLTDYTSGMAVGTPQIVRFGEELFLIMWEESSAGQKVTRLVSVDGNGRMLTDIHSCSYPLSDCQPVYMSDGYVRWFVSNKTDTTLYAVDPFRLNDLSANQRGDINADGKCNITDAVLLQKYLLTIETSLPDRNAGDLDKNGILNANDLTMLKCLLMKQ